MVRDPGSFQREIQTSYGNAAIERIKSQNMEMIQQFAGSRRNIASQRRTANNQGVGGSEIFAAIPRFYDPMEYWDLSGLPWNMTDEGHRHKLHKWLRLYYMTNPLVAALVDIYTRFPMAGMTLECKDSQLTSFYEDLFLDRLDYPEFMVNMGREYWQVGECFPHGTFHEGLGIWEHEELLNPEDIRIENFPLLGASQMKVVPPEYLKRLVATKSPPQFYKQLEIGFPELIPFLKRGEAFPISDVLLKQVAFKVNPWDDHGTPILLRGLRMLLHQEKLYASQDAVAERLFSPLILAKLGTQDLGDNQGPWIPGPAELEQLRDDLDVALASDFRLLVHHFALDIESVFGREQMPDLSNDLDRVERQLMLIFGVNPSLLSAGESSQPYASSALQAEFMNQMLRTYQGFLKQHYRDRAYVVAEAQGHYDYEKKGQTRIPIYEEVLMIDEETGEERIEKKRKLLIPDLDFAVLDMRDEATERAFLQSLRSMGVPIADEDMMIGTSFSYESTLDKMQDEMVKKTVAQQEAKLKAYTILDAKKLPIPAELAAEIDSMNSGADAGGGGAVDAGPGAAGGPGSPIVMPGSPDGNGVPGGGPPITAPVQGGPAGNVPEISNERRPGLTYNTSNGRVRNSLNKHGNVIGKSDEDQEVKSILEPLPRNVTSKSIPIIPEWAVEAMVEESDDNED